MQARELSFSYRGGRSDARCGASVQTVLPSPEIRLREYTPMVVGLALPLAPTGSTRRCFGNRVPLHQRGANKTGK
jgi:hypothetical protein